MAQYGHQKTANLFLEFIKWITLKNKYALFQVARTKALEKP
jgi:hypothetical protein